MSLSYHEVYSRCLAGRCGYPLWTPQLKAELPEDYQRDGLKIGDVGIVSSLDGSFDVLFNITLPPDEQPYPELVPKHLTPVILNPKTDLATQSGAVSANGVISSASVELISRDIHNCDQTPSRYVAFHEDRRAQKQMKIIQRADYEFSLSMEDGAVLILPEGAQSCDLENERKFLDEAVRHGISWYECATEDAGRFIHNDSFYLITGFHKARSWSLGAAGRSSSSLQTRRSAKFKVGTIHQGRETAQAYSWERATHGFMERFGPIHPYQIPNSILGGGAPGGVPNQTVFIRGFRITVNRILFLKTVSVKTQQGTFGGLGTHVINFLWGRTPDSTSSDTQSATDNMAEQDFSGGHSRLYADVHMTVDRVPDVSQVRLSVIMIRGFFVMFNKPQVQAFHPGDSINQYMLKKVRAATIEVSCIDKRSH